MPSSPPEPDSLPRYGRGLVVAIVLLGGIASPALYWCTFGRATSVTPQQAKSLLLEDGKDTLLIDVRTGQEYLAGHIDGAHHWPMDELYSLEGAAQVPAGYQGKRLLLICNVGWNSNLASQKLAALGLPAAINVRGGIQEWIRSVETVDGGDYDQWRTGEDAVGPLPFRESPMYQQAAAVLAFFVIKPIYTLLALGLILVLWKSRDADLVALRWAMIFFFLGENACAANYLVYKENSYLFEYLHSYGMLLCFGFAAFALFDGFDRRILMLSHPDRRCAALGLCGKCIKLADVPCGLKRVFYMLIPAMMIVAAMLPTADWKDTSYNTLVFGQIYNYAHLRIFQLFENWFCATAAVILFALALLSLAFERDGAIAKAKVFFAAGLGPLGFGMLRMLLGCAYDQNRVWYLVWEESTEFLFIVAVCFMLLLFRRKLLPGLEAQIAQVVRLLGVPPDD